MKDHNTPKTSPTPAESATALPEFDSKELFHGGREILIRHRDQCYRLRITRQDKLILTK